MAHVALCFPEEVVLCFRPSSSALIDVFTRKWANINSHDFCQENMHILGFCIGSESVPEIPVIIRVSIMYILSSMLYKAITQAFGSEKL